MFGASGTDSSSTAASDELPTYLPGRTAPRRPLSPPCRFLHGSCGGVPQAETLPTLQLLAIPRGAAACCGAALLVGSSSGSAQRTQCCFWVSPVPHAAGALCVFGRTAHVGACGRVALPQRWRRATTPWHASRSLAPEGMVSWSWQLQVMQLALPALHCAFAGRKAATASPRPTRTR